MKIILEICFWDIETNFRCFPILIWILDITIYPIHKKYKYTSPGIWIRSSFYRIPNSWLWRRKKIILSYLFDRSDKNCSKGRQQQQIFIHKFVKETLMILNLAFLFYFVIFITKFLPFDFFFLPLPFSIVSPFLSLADESTLG